MEIKVLSLGFIGVNCYLVLSEGEAIVIDPGFYDKRIADFLSDNSDKERLILITHGHYDHIGGALKLSRETATKIAIGALENDALSDADLNLSGLFGDELEPFSADILLEEGKFMLGDLEFEIIFTPGHTKGGVCYKFGDVVFSGDTLFCRSIGRTDFPTGDYKTLMNSIEKLLLLPDDTKLLSGHGEMTTLGSERVNNPFLNR